MVNVDIRSICIQSLEDSIWYYDLLSQSEAADSDDFEECKYMYEAELSRLCELYSAEEKKEMYQSRYQNFLNHN